MPIVPQFIKNIRDRRRLEQQALDARRNNTDEENKLLDEAQERFEESRSNKVDPRNRSLHKQWDEYEKAYLGQQWRGSAPPYKSQPVLNFTFALIEAVVPRLTDNDPEMLVLPRIDRADAQIAEQLTAVQSYLQYINRMRQKLGEAARTSMKLGTSILQTVWDPDFHDGRLGDVRYAVVHPKNFFNDPRAYEIDQMEYCFTSTPWALEKIIRRWPDKGPLVVADTDWTDTGDEVAGRSAEQVASVKNYWFRDENGNVCVMFYAGHTVLQVIGGKYDGSNRPVYLHNKFPFAVFRDYPIEKHFWGLGEIEIILLLQRLVNSFEAQIIDNTRLMAHGEYMINKALSGLREEDAWMFQGKPGNQIWTQNGGVQKLPGTPIPAHVPEHLERLIFMMEQILGIHDVVQGRRPVGVRAASAIIALQESANVRIRQKSEHLKQALIEMGDQANWLVLEHYDSPRTVRLVGHDEPTTLNIREALSRRMADRATDVGMIPPLGADEMLSDEQLEELVEELKFPVFDVEVTVGPSVPYSQALVHEQAKEFYQLGIIDRRAVLETTRFPGWEQILERMEGREAAAQAGTGIQPERAGERTFASLPGP